MTHQDLHYLLFVSIVLTDIPICNNERVPIQRQKSPVQKPSREYAYIVLTPLNPTLNPILYSKTGVYRGIH